jgi:putative tryptophan/tyrosine transport system substrate-binding protein
MMNRRAFLTGFGAVLATPLAVGAQQPATPRRVGVLLALLSPDSKEAQAFRQGLLDAGYGEGRDVAIEWRSANGNYARLPKLAGDLVERKVDVIVADITLATEAAKRATTKIPIVMAIVADPVGSGLVQNLAQPGGNVTGLSIMLAELSGKRLQLLREAIPTLARVGVVWNPATPWHAKAVANLMGVSRSLAIELSFATVRTPEEINPAVEAVSRARAQALYVVDGPPIFTNRTTFLRLASQARLPVISGERQYTDEGGLISFGPNYEDQMRRSAAYVDKILKGTKPGNMPIEQPTKFELVINLKTAKALGLTIPPSLLLRADQVIE